MQTENGLWPCILCKIGVIEEGIFMCVFLTQPVTSSGSLAKSSKHFLQTGTIFGAGIEKARCNN